MSDAKLIEITGGKIVFEYRGVKVTIRQNGFITIDDGIREFTLSFRQYEENMLEKIRNLLDYENWRGLCRKLELLGFYTKARWFSKFNQMSMEVIDKKLDKSIELSKKISEAYKRYSYDTKALMNKLPIVIGNHVVLHHSLLQTHIEILDLEKARLRDVTLRCKLCWLLQEGKYDEAIEEIKKIKSHWEPITSYHITKLIRFYNAVTDKKVKKRIKEVFEETARKHIDEFLHCLVIWSRETLNHEMIRDFVIENVEKMSDQDLLDCKDELPKEALEKVKIRLAKLMLERR